jgi:hypothetical protein
MFVIYCNRLQQLKQLMVIPKGGILQKNFLLMNPAAARSRAKH